MKKLLTLIAVLLCIGASAQTPVYDTTVVRLPITIAAKSGAGQRDSIYMPAATTSINGYMPSTAMANIATLQTSMTTANANITSLQTTVTALSTQKTSNTQTGTGYTITANDDNRTIIITNAGTVVITLPTGLADGFRCTIVYQAASGGTLTLATATGVTLYTPLNYKKIILNGTATVVSLGTNKFSLSGNLQ